MENLPILYYSMTILFSGLIVYTDIQFAFAYIIMPRKETLAPLVLSCAASLYILSDAFASVFTIIILREDAARFFLLFRGLVPLLFFIIAPYYLNHVLELKTRIKKINHVFFIAGIASATAITVFSVIYPDLFLMNGHVGSSLYNGSVDMLNRRPLALIRNILLLVYLVYTVIIFLMNAMQSEIRFPRKYTLMGLFVVSYFMFNYFYSILFARQEIGSIHNPFPYPGLIIVILIVLMSFGIIELFINYYSRMVNITEDLKSELYYDSELEIQNKIGFKKDLRIELNKSDNRGEKFSLIFFDIDNFQNINESYGENFGDEILKMLSHRLMDNFAQTGTLYRIGGDEFSFLLKDIQTEDEANNFVSKIISSLKNPFKVSGVSYTLKASFAILFIPQDGNDIDTIMHNAYSTIRSVKTNKNSYEFFRKNLLEETSCKIYTVDLLRNSISKDEFTLFYQPVVDADGTFMYAEALLRCTNSDPAIGGPENFIPLIEKAGLMKDLDNLVVRRAFYDVEMKIKNRFSISINMSADQLVDQSYGDFLSSFAKQHGIEPRHLILEITETNLVQNMILARKSLTELKRNGFIIAIDDFGKGFSSLSYLAELPVDIIKIDMAFVHSVPGDARKETLVKYILDLGHSLGLKVVAEGFELPDQVDFFKRLGCDFFQGYYFSRPIPLQELLVKYLFT